PVLPKVRIGMSPAFSAAFAGGVFIAIPANAPPTKLLLRMVILLEVEFCAKLQHAADTGSRDGAEALRGPCGGIEANSGVQARKGRVVQDIEGFRAKLKSPAFADIEILRDRHIPLAERWSDQNVAAAVSKPPL